MSGINAQQKNSTSDLKQSKTELDKELDIVKHIQYLNISIDLKLRFRRLVLFANQVYNSEWKSHQFSS
ncbi:hypothetical protein LYNGBM3L_44160 [Moorena producens 3L]|uniref:Uncharacterized protein n=1 Tax=Moorena producens 3L TaxID=489825 RepID=F4XWK9_9CYAN|nr:hypothetical protein LYNGBM3L_44160 [Moorena producens 3L]